MALSASIQALLAGELVAGSRLNSKLLDELLAEGLLLVVSRGSRKSYRARDAEALKRFLVDKDERYRLLEVNASDSDERYRLLEVNASDSRATMAAETGNSKLVMVRSCPGFPVNSYERVECFLGGDPFPVNPQEGSFLFVSDWKKFAIPEDVVVMVTFLIKYFSYPDIHNRPILENGCVPFPIIIFTSETLIWQE